MKTPSLRHWAAIVSCAGAALLTSGCVVAPYGYGYGYGGEVVSVAPPAPQYEVVGVAPVAGNIWIGGYWNWVGGRHVWSPGYWSAPRPGHVWVPHAWVHAGGGWRLQHGHWR
ncbi:MAG: YXWGXW repeat-containing protein [Burkholderiales bacterium]|nr:YXWGXW repeat-containing protein [Burkholderiales bacterium]